MHGASSPCERTTIIIESTSNGRMTSVERVAMSSQATLLDHTHEWPHVLIVLEGEIHEDGRVYRSGDLRISSADDRHFLRFAAPTRCVVIEGAMGACSGLRRVIRAPELVNRVRESTDDARTIDLVMRGDVVAERADTEVPAWLLELEARRTGGQFVRGKSVEGIARLAGVSREHLTRSYHRHFGTTVADAIRARRLRQAYDGLALSHLSLADIADACGFSDQSHMTRHFVAWIGRPPGALRQHLRNVTSVQDPAPLGRVK